MANFTRSSRLTAESTPRQANIRLQRSAPADYRPALWSAFQNQGRRWSRVTQRHPDPPATKPCIDHLHHRVPVTDHKAGEAPLVSQYICHQVVVGGTGNAVEFTVGSHNRNRTSIDCRFKGRQVVVVQADPWEYWRHIVIATPFRSAVTGKVLGTGGEGVRTA